jgi:hypothetical protein
MPIVVKAVPQGRVRILAGGAEAKRPRAGPGCPGSRPRNAPRLRRRGCAKPPPRPPTAPAEPVRDPAEVMHEG